MRDGWCAFRCSRNAVVKIGEWQLCRTHERAIRKVIAAELQSLADRMKSRIEGELSKSELLSRTVKPVASVSPSPVSGPLRADSLVYFAERDGYIKIGVTKHLDARMRTLGYGRYTKCPEDMTAGPVKLLRVVPGSFAREGDIHRRFSHLRVRDTEWFHPSAELLGYIEDLRAEEDEARDWGAPSDADTSRLDPRLFG